MTKFKINNKSGFFMNIENKIDFITGTLFLKNLKIGMEEFVKKKVTEKNLTIFAELTDDRNLVHLNEEFVFKTAFGKKIVYVILTASFVSAVIGEYLLRYVTIYWPQTMDFFRPVFPNQIVKTAVIVKSIQYNKKESVFRMQLFFKGLFSFGGNGNSRWP